MSQVKALGSPAQTKIIFSLLYLITTYFNSTSLVCNRHYNYLKVHFFSHHSGAPETPTKAAVGIIVAKVG